MSGLYTSALVAHVLVAVLGLGSIASVAVVAATARTVGRDTTEDLPWLRPLLRYSAFSLAAMLVTGILLDVAAKGAFRQLWWFRASALLLIATGVLNGQARRAVRLGFVKEHGGDVVLRRVGRIAYGMCALIVAITVLMVIKPF